MAELAQHLGLSEAAVHAGLDQLAELQALITREREGARGVAMRTVYLDAVRNDRATLAYAEWLTELGGEIRTSAVLPLRILIVDRVHALVPLTPADNNHPRPTEGQATAITRCALVRGSRHSRASTWQD